MSIKDKINALRAKTTAAGCTDAEAMAAAELAAKLMANHGLSDVDLLIGEAELASVKVVAFWRQRLMSAVQMATNTATLHVRGEAAKIVFYGRAPGPEIASYLYEVCENACVFELKQFRQSAFYKRRRTVKTRNQASADFLTGIANRLSLRLVEQFKPFYSADDRKLAVQALEKAAPLSCEMKSTAKKEHFSEAANAGWCAGARPALNHGVNTAQAPRALT